MDNKAIARLQKVMKSPEFNRPDFHPSQLEEVMRDLDPNVAFAPMDELSDLLEMQPKGLSLADVWMIRAAGISKEELQEILNHGFIIIKGPPNQELLPGLLSDHDLQLLEQENINVQPIRMLMTLGYSVVFIDEVSQLPDEDFALVAEPITDVDKELDRLDRLGYDTHSLKVLLDTENYSLAPLERGGDIGMDIPLDNDIKAQLIADGYTIIAHFKFEPEIPQPPILDPALLFPNIGQPSGNIKSETNLNSMQLKGSTASGLNLNGLLPGSLPVKGFTDGNNGIPVSNYVARVRTRSQPYQAPQPGKGGVSSGPSYAQGRGSTFDSAGAPIFLSTVSKIEMLHSLAPLSISVELGTLSIYQVL